MKKLIFVVGFICLVFFGYQYLVDLWLEPKDEISMDEKEKQEYLESFGVMEEQLVNETAMLSLEQCMEMSYSYDTYSCVSGMLGTEDTDLINMEVIKTDDPYATGKNIYNLFSQGKVIIEMDIQWIQSESDKETGVFVYEGNLTLLQASAKPEYIFTVKDGIILQVEQKGV